MILKKTIIFPNYYHTIGIMAIFLFYLSLMKTACKPPLRSGTQPSHQLYFQ